jgi:ribulose-bisphosphate carboxylase small chain
MSRDRARRSLNKAPVVSTGKAANTNSMMVWQPHGNK